MLLWVAVLVKLVDVVDDGGGSRAAGEGEGLAAPSSCEKDGIEGFLPAVCGSKWHVSQYIQKHLSVVTTNSKLEH